MLIPPYLASSDPWYYSALLSHAVFSSFWLKARENPWMCSCPWEPLAADRDTRACRSRIHGYISMSLVGPFVHNVSFEGVCLTTVILTSGASPGGCLLRAVSHFDGIRGIRGIRGCVHFGLKLRPLSKLNVWRLKNTRKT